MTMTRDAWLLLGTFLGLVLVLAPRLGRHAADALEGRRTFLSPLLGPLERLAYRLAGVRPEAEMSWRGYAGAMLAFNVLGVLVLYALLRLQAWLPLNPAGLGPVPPAAAFNTAVSFTTNTNWQGYAGEITLSHLVQMAGLTAQNFASAATGIAVMAALARGLARRASGTVGNFWADLVRATVFLLLPLAFVLALALVGQGVVQTLAPSLEARLIEPLAGPDGAAVTTQTIPLGPVASQVAIRQIGTNGGGFFNANGAHPLENPTPWSNLLQLLAILALPAALCLAFARLAGDRRQGRALLAAMTAIFVLAVVPCMGIEMAGHPRMAALGVDDAPSALQAGGHMEGKEARFGPASSALWAAATTAASNGSVSAMHDSFMPLGGLVPMILIQLGGVVFGGVGSGVYGMLVFAIVASFVAGLMVGRTPEYMGKKIEAFEMKMASLAILVPALAVLAGTALAVATPAGRAGVFNPGVHGFSEMLYALSSAAHNNGSAFAGLRADSSFYHALLGAAMFVGRFGPIVAVLAIAGSLAAKGHVPEGPGTLPTHDALFVALLVAVVLVAGGLTFLPALAIGPIAEHLLLGGLP